MDADKSSVSLKRQPLDPDKMFAALEEKIKNSGVEMDMGRIRAAYDMARLAHSGQLRRDGSPYVTHCVAAADISVDMGLDEDSVVAALLHDVIEDTQLTHHDIARQFGEPVANIVEGVTKLTRVQYTSKEDEQMESAQDADGDGEGHPCYPYQDRRPPAQYAHHGVSDRGKAAHKVA